MRRYWSAPAAVAVLGVVAVVASLVADGAGYYLHLARGQARLVLRSRRVAVVLRGASLDSLRHERLQLTQDIRRFGVEQLGLAPSRSYTVYYDTQGAPVSYNVSACPPDRLAPHLWRFPFAGSVPYKGFFSLERARTEVQELAAAGFDVYLRPVSAFSTLGYFADPVLSSMLDYPPDVLSDLILHELTHGMVYLPGHTDFNESLATYVGRVGSLDFLAHRYGVDDPALELARQRRRDQERFTRFVGQVIAALDSLYARGLPRDSVLTARKGVFAAGQRRYADVRDSFELQPYDGFLDWEVNNARLLSYRRYHTRLGLFDSLRQQAGGDLAAVLRQASGCQRAADPWACMAAHILPESERRAGAAVP